MNVMKDKSTKIKIQRHNEDIRKLMKDFSNGIPSRVPVLLTGMDERFYILNPVINKKNFTWEQVCNNTDVTIQSRIQKQQWCYSISIPYSDTEFPEDDLPERWEGCSPYFESAHELAIFGAEVYFPETGENPDCHHLLAGDDKWRFTTYKIDTDPDGNGIFGETVRKWKEVKKKCENMKVEGLMIKPPLLPFRLSAGDGPFSIACGLRGIEILTDIYEDPEYFHSLMGWITDGTILKGLSAQDFASAVKVEFYTSNNLSEGYCFSDDSAAMVSPGIYKEFILPYNKKIVSAFSKQEKPICVHMCGQAQHLLKIMCEELNADLLDVGFPCNLKRAREELGPDICFQGNLTPMLLHSGPISAIKGEVLAILRSGVARGKKFILKDGANIPPCTPMENLIECYKFAVKTGRYIDESDNVEAMNTQGESVLPWKNYM